MPVVDFSAYSYYPSLYCSAAELHGYSMLDAADKEALLPHLILNRASYDDEDLEPSIQMLRRTIEDRPFLLDLCKDPPPDAFIPKDQEKADARAQKILAEEQAAASYSNLLSTLINPRDGFAGWRQIAGRFENCIPVLQYSDATSESLQILRQASLLARSFDCLAIRITESTEQDIHLVIPQILAVLDSPAHLLIIIDCGYGRQRIEKRAEFAASLMTSILNRVDAIQQPLMQAVCMSSSFPNLSHDGLQDISSCDWDLWRIAADRFPFLFGDYGSMHRRRPSKTTFIPSDTRPAVVYPLNENWIAYRHPNANDVQGWAEGARAIQRHPGFAAAPDIAGVQLIRQAATGDLTQADRTRHWMAAKVNIHLFTQIRKAEEELVLYDDTDDED